MPEQLYNDFTTKVLPLVKEGLVISKEYFTDLFARYIKYLIIMDTIWTIIGIMGIIIAIWATIKAKKTNYHYSDFPAYTVTAIVLTIISLPLTLISINDLVKDLTIPEVRVYEKFQRMNRIN